ncbi:MAG: peptidyl-prolyl cis-trans isomerase [Clostridiales bacterium]|nr:peptidyl-prolyl cis-trans isomerase [Clostridiales bacterium]
MKCTIITKDYGNMVFELYEALAPITVANFVETVNSGFYNGLGWCRIVKDYVIQGGSPDNDIMTDSDWHIKGEFAANGIDNPIKHTRGAISMARDDDFDSAGTQFFVVHQDANKLDGKYAAFGQLVEGFDVLDLIAGTETYGADTWNKPIVLPIIEKIVIDPS